MSDQTVVATLRQWALDAQTATNAANWVGTTYTAQKDASLKTTIQRLGLVATHLANLYEGDHSAD